MSLEKLIPLFLEEDLQDIGDITSRSIFKEEDLLSATMNCREDIIVAGLDIAKAIFEYVDDQITFRPLAKDGDLLHAGANIASISGPAISLLSAERTALNILMHLSGIATLTRSYVNRIAHTKAKLLDTRKTTPGLRKLEKFATKMGGAENHRIGLFDAVMIKDNHLALVKESHDDNYIAQAIKLCRNKGHDFVEVECDTLRQVRRAINAGASRILLDNMTNEMLKEAVSMNKGKCELEASGNVNLQTIKGIAETGVDYISVGRITHSAPAVDIGLDFG